VTKNTYKVRVNINITEATDEAGMPIMPMATYFTFAHEFNIEGNSFTEIAPRLDNLMKAVQNA
jgi:hypothetical protein